MKKIIIRIDDVVPSMNWRNFDIVFDTINQINKKCLLGVVPDCRDQNLNIGRPRVDFYNFVRFAINSGHSVAQHGYQHLYKTANPGLLKINNRSEFAGLEFSEQYEKLKNGKDLMLSENIWQPIFMAPSHSFDQSTLRALEKLCFTTVTDGFGLYPFRCGDLTFIPQNTAKPLPIPFGIQTMCLHLNNICDVEIKSITEYIIRNQENIISIEDIDLTSWKSREIQSRLLGKQLNVYRKARKFVKSMTLKKTGLNL